MKVGRGHIVDICGQRFGRITVLERVPAKSGRCRWKCQCDCGRIYESYGSHLIHDGVQQCWTCSRTLEVGLAAKHKVFRMYKKNARTRGLPFSLDFESLIGLCILPCKYCGSPPSNSAKKIIGRCNGDFAYSGIDRVDNSIGYIKENCVPCCVTCNMMKKTMGKDNFLTHVKKIAMHQGMFRHV